MAAAAAAAVAHAWAEFLDLHDLRGSSDRLVVAVEALARQYGRSSAALALRQYRTDRRAAGVGGRPAVRMPALPSHEDIVSSVESSLSPLYGAPDEAKTRAAEQSLESSVERLVLDQGRTAIIEAVQDDREAKGWARVTEPGACYFCAMQAQRGAVYKTRETADFRAHNKQPNGSGGTCRCHVEPVFNAYEPTAQIRQWQADYSRLRAENGGKLSLIQWRRAFEGRDGTDRPPLG